MSGSISPKTSKAIVFPFNHQSKTFETDFYDPSLMDHQVSLEELNQFINEMNDECKQAFTKVESLNFGFGFMVISIVVLDLCILLFHSKIHHLNHLLTLGETIFLTSFLSFFICILCGCRLDSTDWQAYMRGGCQDIVDKQNEILRSRGLKWHLSSQFPAWIELTRDMTKKDDHFNIAPLCCIIPETTEEAMIFPRQYCKSEEKSYESSRFSQDFSPSDVTNYEVSTEEIQRFLSQINACLRMPFEVFYKICFVVNFGLCFELFGLLYIFNHFPHLLPTFLIIFIAVISTFVSFVISGFELERAEKNQNTQIKIACQRVVDKENETLQNRGLRWHLPEGFPDWIELSKDSRNQNLSTYSIDILSEDSKSVIKLEDDVEMGNQDPNKTLENTMYIPLLLQDENEKKKKDI